MSQETDEQPARSPLIGQSIGKYKIVRQLGRGGMGAVYAAIHEDIGQGAAIKVMHPELSQEAIFAQRFFDEAPATCRQSSAREPARSLTARMSTPWE